MNEIDKIWEELESLQTERHELSEKLYESSKISQDVMNKLIHKFGNCDVALLHDMLEWWENKYILSSNNNNNNNNNNNKWNANEHTKQTVTIDLRALLLHMRDSYHGITLDDRRYHFRMYHACFIGCELVDWMIEKGWTKKRKNAVKLGELMRKKGLIYHVTKDHEFKDDFLFYRFTETALTPRNVATILDCNINWVFGSMARIFSIGINESLATQIENLWAIQSDQLNQSCTIEADIIPFLRQLRRNCLYFGEKQSWKGWKLQRSSNGLNTYVSEKIFARGKKDNALWPTPQIRPPNRENRRTSTHSQHTASTTSSDNDEWDVGLGGVRGFFKRNLADLGRVLTSTKNTYHSKLLKKTSIIPRTPTQFLAEFMNPKSRRSWDPLLREVNVIETLSESCRIIHRLSSSPLNTVWPRDACVYEDHFMIPNNKNEAKTVCIYEISVEHPKVPPEPGYVRAEIMLIVRIVRQIEDFGNPKSELIIVSQVDFCGDVPDWVMEKWIGGVSAHDSHRKRPAGLIKEITTNETGTLTFDSCSTGISVNDFEALAVLGRGAYSKIFQVRHIATSKFMAMKVLNKRKLMRVKQLDNVKREQRIMSNIRHPFMVKLHFSFQTASNLYLVMDYASGGDMFTFLQRNGCVNEQVAKIYVAELILAIRYLHSKGIAHRDIKPENMLIASDGHLLLADLGLAKDGFPPNPPSNNPEFESYDTLSTTLVGTAEYIAPEMISCHGHDLAVDWWQVGIILHEMITGKHPFYAPNTFHMHQKVLRSEPLIDKMLSHEANTLITGLLHKDPQLRLGNNANEHDIEKHPFFSDIDWQHILQKKYVAPMIPSLQGPHDISSFGAEFTQEPPQINSPPITSNLQVNDGVLTDFSYRDENSNL